MRIEQITRQGQGTFNEDGLIISPSQHIYGVVDGVSGLQPLNEAKPSTSSGRIASELIVESFHTSGLHKTLADMTLEANARLRQKMTDFGVDTANKDQLWGAVHAVIRIHDEHIEWVQSGDCMIYALYQDGFIRTVTYDSVEMHDRRALSLWRDKYGSILLGSQKPEEVTAELRRNRCLANSRGGYSVLNGDPALANHIETGNIARNGLTHLLLITDGIYPWLPLYSSPGNGTTEFVRDIAHQGLARYVDRLCKWEEGDPACAKSPRFKTSDDKTGILLRF